MWLICLWMIFSTRVAKSKGLVEPVKKKNRCFFLGRKEFFSEVEGLFSGWEFLVDLHLWSVAEDFNTGWISKDVLKRLFEHCAVRYHLRDFEEVDVFFFFLHKHVMNDREQPFFKEELGSLVDGVWVFLFSYSVEENVVRREKLWKLWKMLLCGNWLQRGLRSWRKLLKKHRKSTGIWQRC